MARWVNIGSATGGSLSGTIEYEQGTRARAEFFQDEKPFLEQAKIDRELGHRPNFMGAKKFATIPDIVAIEILEKYGINIHEAETLADRDKMKKFKYIVETQYPDLLSS